MEFVSTRGVSAPCGFMECFLHGLAEDGGLYLPAEVPTVSAAEMTTWREMGYADLAFAFLSRFVQDEIPAETLRALIAESYRTFRAPQVTPMRRLGDNQYVLELFHGPTYAFKDVALQLMGNLYAYAAERFGVTINILGATSGDTGAAAIHGVRGKAGIKICILHPHGRVSRIQEQQMTTVLDANVLNLSVHGDFDDCQRMVKEIFGDLDVKRRYSLRAINSINLARILAQTVYYFYAYFRTDAAVNGTPVDFSVPTGNFGDIFAGYLAKRMGLPIRTLLLATNENNILERFVNAGEYRVSGATRATHSPSMDIQIASNFERYLYYLLNEDAAQVRAMMAQFAQTGALTFDDAAQGRVRQEFAAHAVSNDACLKTITHYYTKYGYLVDPHTACGLAAHEACGGDVPCITLSTAHPAKFPEALAQCGVEPTYPGDIAALQGREQRMTVIGNAREEALTHLLAHCGDTVAAG